MEAQPELAARVSSAYPDILAQVVYAVEEEGPVPSPTCCCAA